MSTSIFIKTCAKDLPWLKYCLRSIWKFAHGIEEVIIVADKSCVGHDELPVDYAIIYHYVDDWPNGYIQQQYVKLNADQYTKSEQILFVDSDCVFTTPFNPWSFMRDDKPVLLKTRYGNLGGAEAWKGITEAAVGWPVEYEYMRRLPWMYRRDTIIKFRAMFPGIVTGLKGLTGHGFSEFNALGAFIDKFEQDKYYISDTEAWMPSVVAKQFWSWGELTQAIKDEIEGMLK